MKIKTAQVLIFISFTLSAVFIFGNNAKATDFSTLGTNGQVRNYTSGTWSDLRNASAGTDKDENDFRSEGGKISDFVISRGFLTIDTSAIADDATIESAVLHIKTETCFAGGEEFVVIESTQTSDTGLALDDFNNFNTTELSDVRETCTTDTSKAITLNASGIALINKTGYTKFALLEAHDFDNVEPTGREYILYQNDTAYLSITTSGGEQQQQTATTTQELYITEQTPYILIFFFSIILFLIGFITIIKI